MSMCLATKFGGAAMSITALAQVVPADPAAAGVELYQKYGIVGLLIAVVVALWIDGKREASKAEAVARGIYVFAIYGFQNKTFDFAAIKALAMPETPSAPPATTGDLSHVTWLHANVADWPQTATLDASVSGNGSVSLAYDKAKVWPGIDGLNSNPCVIVKWQDGKTYAATWEWLRTGQTSKSMGGKSWGGHIKVAPLSKWEPKSGETVGFMVSGLARDGRRNVKERSNVDMVTWP